MDYKIGDRIELVRMDNDPDPILPGARGTVEFVNVLRDMTQLGVAWDDGRRLMAVLPDDVIRKIND